MGRSVLLVDFGGIGGVYDSVVATALALNERGHRCDVLAPDLSRTGWLTSTAHVRDESALLAELCSSYVYKPPRLRLSRAISFAARAIGTSSSMLRQVSALSRRYDVVAVEGRFIAPVVSAAVARAAASGAARVVFVPHNSFSRHRLGLVRTLDDRWISKAALNAHQVVLHDQDLGALPRSLRVVEAPLVAPVQSRLSTRTARAPRPQLRLLTAGYLRPDKGVLPLARELQARKAAVHYMVTAPSEADGSIAKQLESLQWEGLELQVGFKPARAFIADLDDADALVLPYLRSTGSGLLQTAIAIGLPVVSTPFAQAVDWADRGAAVTLARDFSPGAVADAVEHVGSTPAAVLAERVRVGRQLFTSATDLAVAAYVQ